MTQLGVFYGIGVGPGDPELLTLKAARILREADVICLPQAKAGALSVARQVAGPHFGPRAQVVEISTPMVRDEALLEEHWQQGAARIADFLRQGLSVAFLTIGDSMLYSTYTYLLARVRRLLSAVRVECVPGITSFSAAASFLQEALAEGAEKLAVVPAIEDPDEIRQVLRTVPNAVLMKVAGQYDAIVDVLEELNLLDKAVFVSRLGYGDQLVCRDLVSLKGRKLEYLSLILVKREGFQTWQV